MGIQESRKASSQQPFNTESKNTLSNHDSKDASLAFHWLQVFLDAPFPATGKSDVEGYFDPPYFEWWAASKVSHFFRLESDEFAQQSCHTRETVCDDALARSTRTMLWTTLY